jgi:LacI family transcriptional regulator
MAQLPRVILAIDTRRSGGRGILRGIAKYARLHGPWTFRSEPSWLERPVRSWKGQLREADGLVIEDPVKAAEIQKMSLAPTISVSPGIDPDLPSGVNYVTADSNMIGRLGAEHLLERGFRHFASCGFEDVFWSVARCRAFADRIRLADRDHIVQEYQIPYGSSVREKEQGLLINWLKALPHPVGLMACNDICGEQIIEACKQAQIHVPEQIAVVGSDNDDLQCELADPTLTSINLDLTAGGFAAAALLDRMMSGEKITGREIELQATHVVQRRSTEVLAVTDPEILAALRYIRENVRKPLQVADAANATALSRRSLEQRFRTVLHRTILEEIRRQRTDHIARLLLETDYSILQIAMSMGFSSVNNISRYFRIAKGMTPRAFRQKFRAS